MNRSRHRRKITLDMIKTKNMEENELNIFPELLATEIEQMVVCPVVHAKKGSTNMEEENASGL